MSLVETVGAVQIGTTPINRTRVPVFRLPSGEDVVEQTDTVSGLLEVIGVVGAKRFKSQEYVFHPELEPAIVEDVFSRPLALLSEGEQEEVGDRVLRALFNRVLASGVEFDFMAVRN